jgi:transposase
MPAHRLTMRLTREILRLRLGLALPIRHVARSCHVSPSTVCECLARAEAAGLPWPLPADLDDGALEARLYPGHTQWEARAEPDYAALYRELKRRGVTLQLLWHEYKQQHPDDGYQYSQFCARYRRWRAQLDVVMRQEHRAGEKLFVDYAGQPLPIVQPATGAVRELAVFVAALGASNYTFAEAHDDQSLASWLAGHIHAFEFFQGVATAVVPDNAKTGVTKACRYEPDLNPSYQELATYYGTVILPARPAKPRDKAKVENAVLQVERWVLAPLRHRQFFSRAEANQALAQRLTWLNTRPFAKLAGSRRSLFEELDRPALQPLPARRYEPAEWKTDVGVNIDYHIEFARHYYSVPYQLVGQRIDVRATPTTVECFYRHRRIASHPRSTRAGHFTTDPAHRPKAHQRAAEWSPSRLIRWAETLGPHTAALVTTILERKPHPEQGFRTCLGILRLAKRYGAARLEPACQRAQAIGALSYRSLRSMLDAGLECAPLPGVLPSATPPTPVLDHPNLRGPTYYS